ncbi:hypothetical protein ACFE04_028370 [Oxalis oulophora]
MSCRDLSRISSYMGAKKVKMEGFDHMGLLGDHNNFDPGLIGRLREDGYDSRSGSDNFEGGSGDDQEANNDTNKPAKRKKYHRHTPNQIQELENFFKECPHPDEKQRTELSRRLSLETKQIKFWFQNRRTQMKTQLERHENVMLRQENDKLRAENDMLKHAMNPPICNNCGGQAIAGEVSYEQHQLRIENARLKDDLGRICTLANKFVGKPFSSVGSLPPTGLELAVGRNGAPLPTGLDFGDAFGMPSMMKPMMGMAPVNESHFDKSALVNLALAAMDELIKIVHADNPLWCKSFDGKKDMLNLDEYMRTFSPCIGMKPTGFTTEASRDSCMVIVNSMTLVDTLMDANRWQELFPSIVARASTIDVVSSGVGGTKSGMLQMMQAEFQLLSPLVPVRQIKFLRFCKQHAEGLWVVVDVSIDINLDGSDMPPFVTCRRLPSGCVVQDMPNGSSKVIWVEHSEYDASLVHELYRPLVSTGLGFGAHRMIAALQRQFECLAIFLSPPISCEDTTGITLDGKKSMMKLAQRMADNFCTGICTSSVRNWHKLNGGNVGKDVRVSTRQNVNDPGEPPGVVLSAATSVYVKVSRQRLFDFLRDERTRSSWDILSNGGPMEEMIQIPKGQASRNCVSLLRANAINSRDDQNSMLILQETWNDASGSLVVYAPVDIPSISIVMSGGDSAYVALLPSGFAILPPGPSVQGGSDGTPIKEEVDSNENDGCLLTVGFQILVNSLPTAKITQESVETVNHLISCTIQKINAALEVA